GTTPGTFTPRACVASNDLALGRLVEAVSQSSLWKETAIFVIEDDAQNGPDHVDAPRTVGLVISPYVKRRHLDSTQYSTVSMVRTIELILGLSPLSQYDAAARPMYASFTDKADLAPYIHEKARIDLDATNPKTAYGALRSQKMDFSDYDKVDDFELNEILWRSIKGVNAEVPPPVRRAIANRPGASRNRNLPGPAGRGRAMGSSTARSVSIPQRRPVEMHVFPLPVLPLPHARLVAAGGVRSALGVQALVEAHVADHCRVAHDADVGRAHGRVVRPLGASQLEIKLVKRQSRYQLPTRLRFERR